MPRSLYDWYSLNTLDLLGQRQVLVAGEIEFKRLKRFRDLLHSPQGSVRAEFKFGQRAAGYTTVRLKYDASYTLQCQRCLEPMEEQVTGGVSFVVVEGDSVPAGIPDAYEPMELSGDRFQPATCVEDELIMSLPLIPRHARDERCGALARSLAARENNGGAGSSDASPARH